MSEVQDKESKTEEPTEKKLRDSAEDGNVAFSREVPVAAGIVFFSLYFSIAGQDLATSLGAYLRDLMGSTLTLGELSAVDVLALASMLSRGIFFLLAPLTAVLVISGLVSSLLQNEPRLVRKRIQPDLSRLSPGQGWNRIFSSRSVVEFAKSFGKVAAAALLVVLLMRSTLRDIANAMFQNSGAAALTLSMQLRRLFFAVSFAAALIAALDYVWVRYTWLDNLRMSRQDVKDEMKQSEGDPTVKARLRSLGRDRARRRAMNAVRTATLVVANPTHVAVALRYNRESDPAPVVVAMGADLLAQRIRAIAEETGIPIFVQIELARAIYKSVKVDQVIPPQFYKALAELIRSIHDISGKTHAQPAKL